MIGNDIYIGRQPILDTTGTCIAYELLYRDQSSVIAEFSDNTMATSRVLLNLLHNIGIDSLIGNKTGFINVDGHTLLSETILSIPKERFVIEILEHTKMSVAIVQRVREMHAMGYRFALDDFCCRTSQFELFRDLFPYLEIIKIDLLMPHDIALEAMASRIREINPSLRLLAEKIESMEIFERCKAAGFELFQGYFFEKPTVISGKQVEPCVLDVIDLINTLHTTDSIDLLSRKFALYPELTFNLLRHVNSAAYHFTREITSIPQILTLLGPARLRSWLGLFLYAGSERCAFAEAIFHGAKFRAKLMFELSTLLGKPKQSDEAFLIGSISLIDSYLQIPMSGVLEKIGLSASISDALLYRKGYMGKLLTVTEKLETTEKIEAMCEYLSGKLDVQPKALYELYVRANEFALSTE